MPVFSAGLSQLRQVRQLYQYDHSRTASRKTMFSHMSTSPQNNTQHHHHQGLWLIKYYHLLVYSPACQLDKGSVTSLYPGTASFIELFMRGPDFPEDLWTSLLCIWPLREMECHSVDLSSCTAFVWCDYHWCLVLVCMHLFWCSAWLIMLNYWSPTTEWFIVV